MAEKITRKVNIEYLASGLDNIIKSFEKLDPSTLSTKAQKSATEIVNIATTMRDQFKTAIAKGDISEEAAKQYEAMYNKFLGPDFSNKFRAILAGVGGDFDAAFNGMSERALQLNKDIANIESKITVEQKGFKTDGNNIDFATNTKRNEEAQKALKEVLKENQDIEEKSLTRAKEKLPTYENLQQAQERANAALAKMTPTQQKQLENFIKTGEVTDANRANVEKLVKTMEGNLSVQEVQARLRAKQLIDEKLSNTLNEKKNTLRDLENQKIEKNKELQKALDPVKMAEEEVRAQEKATNSKKTYNKNQAATVDILATVSNEIQNKKLRDEEQEKQLRTTTREVEKNVTAVKRQNNTLGKAANQVFNYGVAFGLLRRIYRETLRTIRDLDKALTEMAIVTTMGREEAFKLADTMSNLARQTGFTTTEIAKLSTVFFRQGRALSEVIELTTVAAKSARIAGISAADSANFLTSAVNGFGLAANQVLAVSDRFAALAASSASSYQELAVGLSKFAAQANVAGVGIDFAMGMLAKGIETTREAPETIGTALKTVIARMRELTDLGKTLEDGMDVSRVETALRQVGIALRDENGQFRDLEKVLTEIGMAWNTYDRNQQASIAVSLAGTRQQSRLIAIMQDFDRTLELVNISQESAGATNAQQVEYMKSLEAATVQLQTA
jgi:TP901 family phage tail tape measure protein